MNSQNLANSQILIGLEDTRTVTLSGITIPHWNLTLTGRNVKKLTALNHAAGIAGGSVSKARKTVEGLKSKKGLKNLNSRVRTMNAMTMGEWTPSQSTHLDHGQDVSEQTSQNRGKFMVGAMAPKDVDE